MRHTSRSALIVVGVAVLLVACGGGDGGQDAPVVPPAQTSKLEGTAATGRPFAGATVTVFDAASNAVTTTTVAADGSYAATVPASTRAPLVLEATLDNVTLVSAIAETKDSRANITPLTSLIASRLAPDGNPTSLKQNSSG